jgi:GNAT superfamily N-acetyltransferase
MQPFTVRPYAVSDETSWLQCRALSFLGSQYYDDVRPRRLELEEPAIALVAVNDNQTVIGVLDLEIEGDRATIDTVAVHPDHQGHRIATTLLHAAIPELKRLGLGVSILDAWTREDPAANAWYQRNGFIEKYRYMHVYLGDDDIGEGFTTPDGLSSPVSAFMHAPIEREHEVRERYARTYVCRQYELRLDTAAE